MKPEIGTKIYCIYKEGILVDNVAFIGKESFIIENVNGYRIEAGWEWFYEDYNNEWFIEPEKAKEKLLSIATEKYKERLKIKPTLEDWYELVEIED